MLISLFEVVVLVVIFGIKICVCEMFGVFFILFFGDIFFDLVKDFGILEVIFIGFWVLVIRVVMVIVCVSVIDGNFEKILVMLLMFRVNFGVDVVVMLWLVDVVGSIVFFII